MGKIKNREGEISYNSKGLRMTLIKYNNCDDIIVRFDDGTERKTQYRNFKNGHIRHPNDLKRIGEIGHNNFGSKMEIIKYNNYHNIDVYFPEYDWIYKNATYQQFKNGEMSCPYEPRTYGVGYLGEGKYKSKENGKMTYHYDVWTRMLERCSKEFQEKNPTYKGCEVCDEWLNMQVFTEWYYKNRYEVNGETMEIDKDILIPGNRLYSPETCCIVPSKVNSVFQRGNVKERNLPMGICKRKGRDCYMVQCNNPIDETWRRYRGDYKTIEEALNVYKRDKEFVIKQVSEYYKEYLPEFIYEAMINWEIQMLYA